jgi:effector-binding domain-containing protein
VTLRRRLPLRTSFDQKELPAATLACAYAQPDDESAEQVYRGLRKWVNARGYRVAGPKREIYMDSLLEIQFPPWSD